MATLKYKTISNTTIRDKSKVFIYCHSNDLEKFNLITQDIFKINNCSIWYFEDHIVNQEYDNDLSKMDLFVFILSNESFNDENLIYIYKQIKKNKIPFLPIIVNKVNLEKYNLFFENAQYLDYVQTDYFEKLKVYIDQVLVSENEVNDIKGEFDAYIFLSYRKKDRNEVEKLISKIHENEVCRDVAIWNDDFLIPGEDFNDTIKDALLKCDVFALAITPNMVNEENYVLSTEYPLAVKNNKLIIPVELIETNKEEINSKLSNLPKLVVSDKELTEELLNVLNKLSTKEKDKTPLHNYLIGLAYLYGVDVKKDYDLAFKLIKDAADNSLLVANRKLSIMYRTGLGLDFDYKKALPYQVRAQELSFKEYENNPTLDNLMTAYWECQYCADAYNEFENHAKSLEYKQIALSILENSSFKEETIYQQIVSLNDIGGALNTLNRPNEAIEAYNKAGALIDSYNIENKDITKLVSLEGIGDIYYNNIYYSAAKSYYEKIIDILNNLDLNDEILRYKVLKATTSYRLGVINNKLNDPQNAFNHLKVAFDLMKVIIQENGTMVNWRNYIAIYVELGEVYNRWNQLDNAIVFYNESIRMADYLINKGIVVHDFKRLKSSALIGLGDIYTKQKKYPSAEEAYLKMYEIIKERHEQINNARTLEDLASTSYKIRNFYYSIEDYVKADTYLFVSYSLKQKLAFSTNHIEHFRSFESILEDMGDMYLRKGLIDEAKEYYKYSLKIAENLIEVNRNINTQFDLASRYLLMSKYASESKDYLLKSKKLYEEILKDNPNHQDSIRDLEIINKQL